MAREPQLPSALHTNSTPFSGRAFIMPEKGGNALSGSKVCASGYGDAGASLTKRSLRAFNAHSGAPIEDIDFHNATMRQRGRMLYMASPIAAAAVNTNRTKIVGPGLRMKCSLDAELLGLSPQAAKEWCKRTEAEFRAWCSSRTSCDALGLNNFYEMQQLAVKSWLMSGDVFALLKRQKPTRLNPYSLCVQLIEADRICTPYSSLSNGFFSATEGKNGENEVHDGIEVEKSGRVVAYHVCNNYPYSTALKDTEWVRVEAISKKTGLPNMLQIMDSERPDQYRGVTYLAPVIEMLLQNRRYTESELTAAIIQTYFTGWLETDTDSTDMPMFDHEEEDEDETEPEMAPGNVVKLKKGEKIVFGNPNIPTAGYETFTNSIARQIGAALEMPHEVLLKEFTASYSASKGALEEAWEVIKMRRSWFVNDFCQPVYEVWLAEAVARGRITAPGFFDDPLIRAAWCGARWDGPALTQLDPKKEAESNAMLVAHGWKTNEQITREYYGENWEDNVAAIAAEKALIKSTISGSDTSEKGKEDDGNAEEE